MKRIVIFGATGNLAARYLIPALAKLYETEQLPRGIKITGVDRRGWKNDKNGFRRLVLNSLERHASSVSADARARLVVEALEYKQADVTDAGSVIEALGPLDEPIVAYLALPRAVFAPTIEALKRAELPEGSQIAIEKPFEENLESAETLNGCCTSISPRSQYSASTTSSPGSRSRQSWACALPTASSNRCGTATT